MDQRGTNADDELDDVLVTVAAGDVDAFADLYDRTSERVYGMVLRVVRDRVLAEDVTQDAYLQVWRTASRFDRDAGSAIAWLITLAHRRAVDRVRSEQAAVRRDRRYGSATGTEFDAVTEQVLARDDARRVADCVGTLSAGQRESIGLAYYGGLTYREVAEQLDIGVSAVKSRIRDAFRRLRACLGSPDSGGVDHG